MTKPTEVHELQGTKQPSRHDKRNVVTPIVGVPVKPDWLKGLSSKVWDEKVKNYTQRSMSVIGLEGPLSIFCAFEAQIINIITTDRPLKASLVAEYRNWCVQFFDTPKSFIMNAPITNTGNKFKRNMKRS